MSATSDNAQGTLAFASGSLITSGSVAALSTTGQTQLIAAVFVIVGVMATIFRAWLRAP